MKLIRRVGAEFVIAGEVISKELQQCSSRVPQELYEVETAMRLLRPRTFGFAFPKFPWKRRGRLAEASGRTEAPQLCAKVFINGGCCRISRYRYHRGERDRAAG